MEKILVKSILDGWLFGLAIWFISQVGLVLSYYILGPVFVSIFLVVAGWPNVLFSMFLAKNLSNSADLKALLFKGEFHLFLPQFDRSALPDCANYFTLPARRMQYAHIGSAGRKRS